MYRNDYQPIFRQRLKEAREKKGLTQSALAKKLGTTDKRIIRWEKPMRHKDGTTDMETLPRLDNCVELCKALDIDLDYLLGNKDIPNDEIPFMQREEPTGRYLTQKSLVHTAEDTAENWHFRMRTNGMVENNNRVLRRNLRRSMRYMRFNPFETTSNFFSSFARSLSEIEE